MRATERLRKLEAREAEFSAARLLRGVAYTIVHVLFVLCMAEGCRWLLLGEHGPHDFENLLYVMLVSGYILGPLMVALVIMGANPLATASAAVAWLVNQALLSIALQARHSDPFVVTVAVVCFSLHLVVLARCVVHRPARFAVDFATLRPVVRRR